MEVSGEFGKGVTFSTAADDFAVLLRARAQLESSVADSDAAAPELGASVRRMRVLLGGHALNRLMTYYIQLGFSSRDLEEQKQVPLRDAFVTWHLHPSANLRVGQMKVPFDRQRLLSSSRLQLIERAEVVNELNLDRDIGAQLYGDLFGGWARYFGGVFNGDGRNQRNSDAGLLYVGKLQLFALGPFSDGQESDLKRVAKPRLALTGAAAFNQGARRTRGSQGEFLTGGRADMLSWTTDLLFQYGGFSLSGEYLRRQITDTDATAMATLEQELRPGHGYFAQAGYMFAHSWEVAARAGRLMPLGLSSIEPSTELVAGVNWLRIGHDLKVQGNYTMSLSPGQREQRLRLQLQMFF